MDRFFEQGFFFGHSGIGSGLPSQPIEQCIAANGIYHPVSLSAKNTQCTDPSFGPGHCMAPAARSLTLQSLRHSRTRQNEPFRVRLTLWNAIFKGPLPRRRSAGSIARNWSHCCQMDGAAEAVGSQLRFFDLGSLWTCTRLLATATIVTAAVAVF